MKQRVYISKAINEERLPFIHHEELKFGRAHYSWKIIADLYRQGLDAAGLETQLIVRPEIYQTEIAKKTIGLRRDDVHISVKPIEHIRPFYGIKNIFICGWEFPEFSDKSYGGDPLLNHISIMKHADRVWCWSDFTTNNLASYGVNAAITMPPPVIIPLITDDKPISNVGTLALNTTREPVPSDIKPLGDILDKCRGSAVFISVLNPFDRRKQIHLMLAAFLEALKKNPNILLIIKLVIDNVHTTVGNIQEILEVHYNIRGKNDRIVFIGETLTKSQMTKLAQSARFYFCASSTEGLNLPMIEAMSLGIVPVSSRATAMADYIHEENAVVIEHEVSQAVGDYHALHNHMQTTHFPPLLPSCINALVVAANATKDKYEALSGRAKKDVYEKYSLTAFVSKLNSMGMLK